MGTLCPATSSLHQCNALGGQAGFLGLSIFGKESWGISYMPLGGHLDYRMTIVSGNCLQPPSLGCIRE